MTVAPSPVYAELNWTGAETAFAPGIFAESTADIALKYITAGGAIVSLIDGIHLTLAKAGNPGVTGTISATPLAMPAAPGTVTFERISADVQPTPFADLAGYSAKVHEKLHDLAALRAAEFRRGLLRAVKAPPNEVGPDFPGLAKRQASGAGGVVITHPDGSIDIAPPSSDSNAQAAAILAEIQALLASVTGVYSTPVIKNAGDTITNTDKNHRIVFEGNVFWQVNFALAANFDNDFVAVLWNNDTRDGNGRGRFINFGNGYYDRLLLPGESVIVIKSEGAIVPIDRTPRYRIDNTTPMLIHVGPADAPNWQASEVISALKTVRKNGEWLWGVRILGTTGNAGGPTNPDPDFVADGTVGWIALCRAFQPWSSGNSVTAADTSDATKRHRWTGSLRSANGKIYECTTSGVTGVTAPAGTGTGIADGTAVWRYVCGVPSATNDGLGQDAPLDRGFTAQLFAYERIDMGKSANPNVRLICYLTDTEEYHVAGPLVGGAGHSAIEYAGADNYNVLHAPPPQARPLALYDTSQWRYKKNVWWTCCDTNMFEVQADSRLFFFDPDDTAGTANNLTLGRAVGRLDTHGGTQIPSGYFRLAPGGYCEVTCNLDVAAWLSLCDGAFFSIDQGAYLTAEGRTFRQITDFFAETFAQLAGGDLVLNGAVWNGNGHTFAGNIFDLQDGAKLISFAADGNVANWPAGFTPGTINASWYDGIFFPSATSVSVLSRDLSLATSLDLTIGYVPSLVRVVGSIAATKAISHGFSSVSANVARCHYAAPTSGNWGQTSHAAAIMSNEAAGAVTFIDVVAMANKKGVTLNFTLANAPTGNADIMIEFVR